MFLLSDLWELYVSFFYYFFFPSVLRANVSAFRVQRGPHDHKDTEDLGWGQWWQWVAVQGCPRATTPAGPGLIPGLAELLA